MDFPEETDVKIGDLTTSSKRINVFFKVVNKGESREVSSRDGSTHRVADVLVGDDTGTIVMSLWDDTIDQVEVDSIFKLSNGYVTVFKNSMRLSVGKYGHLEASEEAIAEVNEENALSDRFVERPRRRGGRYGGGGGGYGDRRGGYGDRRGGYGDRGGGGRRDYGRY